MASDGDSGSLGNVTFQLLSPDQDSTLWDVRTTGNGRGQLFAIGNLDRESVNRYIVPVLARDGGDPAQTATANVLVTVADVNDNTPTLDRSEYAGIVLENTGPGILITRVTAVDGDEGANGNITISLSDNTHFTISSSGEVTTRTAFDYETDTVFNLFITASGN